MTEQDAELRPAYRTLNDPARLLGISLTGWIALLVAGGCGYAWLLVSPLGWRANISVAVIGLGTPAALLLLREESTVSPGRLLLAVLRWRARAPRIVAVTSEGRVRRGAVRLSDAAPAVDHRAIDDSLAWPGEPETRG